MYFDFNVLGNNYPIVIDGLFLTVRLCFFSLLFGGVGAVFLCLGKLSKRGLGYHVSVFIIDFFRTIPEIVLIFWIYSCLPLLFGARLSAEVSGILALSLLVAANIAEVLRAGVQSTNPGQLEAAISLGLPARTIWLRIVIPPAIQRMAPNFVNFLTELIKATSLLSTIGVAEMVYQANVLGNRTFAYVEFLTLVAVIFFVMILPLSLFVRHAEARLIRQKSR